MKVCEHYQLGVPMRYVNTISLRSIKGGKKKQDKEHRRKLNEVCTKLQKWEQQDED